MDLDEQIAIWKVLKEFQNRENKHQHITIAECIVELEGRSGEGQEERDKLLKVLKKNEKISYEFNVELILKWLIQIADAINFLHNYKGKKIIHCDLKPKNIFILKGEIKLGDFGISKIRERGDDKDFTERNIGTEGYQAPELSVKPIQENETQEKPNESVDIWFKKMTKLLFFQLLL
jgi:serine/threonine protein kinase